MAPHHTLGFCLLGIIAMMNLWVYLKNRDGTWHGHKDIFGPHRNVWRRLHQGKWEYKVMTDEERDSGIRPD